MTRSCRLAILTDEVSQDLEEVIRFAREFALHGIEVRSLFGRAFLQLSHADLTLIAQRCREEGLAVAGCASPVFKCDLDSRSEITAHIEFFKRSVDAAHTLGCDLIRVFTFLRRTNPATAGDLARAASHFGELLEIVRGSDIRIGVENEASCIVATGPEMRDFLLHLPSGPHLSVVWDPCNVLYVEGGNDPVHEDFPLIAHRVADVHIKDAARLGRQPAATCVELGRGQVDLPAQMRALKALNYRGWITLETHWRAVALDPESQHLPAGFGFSAGAEPASRICMAHLKTLMAQA